MGITSVNQNWLHHNTDLTPKPRKTSLFFTVFFLEWGTGTNINMAGNKYWQKIKCKFARVQDYAFCNITEHFVNKGGNIYFVKMDHKISYFALLICRLGFTKTSLQNVSCQGMNKDFIWTKYVKMCQQYKGMFLVPKSLRSRGVSPHNCRLLPSRIVKFYENEHSFYKKKLCMAFLWKTPNCR